MECLLKMLLHILESLYTSLSYVKTTDQPTIELPAALIAALSQTAYKATPQSAASAELTAGIKTEEV